MKRLQLVGTFAGSSTVAASRHRRRLAAAPRLLILVNLLILVSLAATVRPLPAAPPAPGTYRVTGSVVDEASRQPIPARVYVASRDGQRHFTVESVAEKGSAVPYQKKRSEQSFEIHTAVSAHSWFVDLPPGEYRVTVERGKEYLPRSADFRIVDTDLELELRLTRWIDFGKLGWYSGETHVHRTLDEIPTAMLADDLNVAFPLTYWVTAAYQSPVTSRRNQPQDAGTKRLIEVDPTHVIYTMNTEYEIFTVNDRRHTLGAIFAIHHQKPLELGVPPVRPVAEEVRRQGGLLELDKHNWPWSMMLIPVMNVDLYELTNNHIWRTEFLYHDFGEMPPPYMRSEQEAGGVSENGWIDFTFDNYYALLNHGFRLRPTAGTASGVHPVPLGYGRVYVYLPDGFSYEAWVEGLDAGRSFVTTGPLLDVRLDDQRPGTTTPLAASETANRKIHFTGTAYSDTPLDRIEIIAAGEVVQTLVPENQKREAGGFESTIDLQLPLGEHSTWYALRCYQKTSGGRRERFAHTAAWFFDVKDRPLPIPKVQTDYLVERVRSQLQRSKDTLRDGELEEYREALRAYQERGDEVRQP